MLKCTVPMGKGCSQGIRSNAGTCSSEAAALVFFVSKSASPGHTEHPIAFQVGKKLFIIVSSPPTLSFLN